jgi:hypothetical protein
MLGFDDPRWPELNGGYRVPFDPRPLLLKLEAGEDVATVWKELWQELHHQGDVAEASYAAVPHLVRIHRLRGVVDWNTYALVGTIELARDSRANPPIPTWLSEDYTSALQGLADLGRGELRGTEDIETVRSILSILAIAKGARVYGRVIAEFSEDEVLELEKQAFGEPEPGAG